jgi:arylsulfatase A-like enzyme
MFMKLLRFFFPAILFITCATGADNKVAVIIVLDGVPFSIFQKILPFCKGGFKELFQQGIVYDNACYPYAALVTGPGHTTLNTGALPRDHGIIDNSWVTKDGRLIRCDEGDPVKAAVFNGDGVHKYGKSPEHMLVDGVSEQLRLAATKKERAIVTSLSNKSRAAVCMAGTMGEALWCDDETNQLTSSKYYFDKLPSWVISFNKSVRPTIQSWDLVFSKNHDAYAMVHNATNAVIPSLAGGRKKLWQKDPRYTEELFEILPASVEYLAQAATYALQQHLKQNPKNILLWTSFSATDKIAHLFGPDSLDYIDMLYHLDAVLGKFMATIRKLVGKRDLLFVFTADHGQLPMVEVLQQRGFPLARRINTEEIRIKLNDHINKQYGLTELIIKIDAPWVFLNEQLLQQNAVQKQQEIIALITQELASTPGIRAVWTIDQLQALPSQPHDWISRFKNQVLPGRSGRIIFQVEPYTYAAPYPSGTGHSSPYNYSTQVPLIWYIPKDGDVEGAHVQEQVWLAQVAPSLSKFFGVPRPSAALYPVLPQAAYLQEEKCGLSSW